jgi:hypothetical protein
MSVKLLMLSASLVLIISCRSTASLDKNLTVEAQQKEENHIDLRESAERDSIAKLQQQHAYENGGEEALMELMKNEENIFIKYEHRFKKMMNDDVIPETFPVYIDGTSEKDYLEIVDFWAKNNPDFLKPQFRR